MDCPIPFDTYTEDMWNGNKPSCKGDDWLINGKPVTADKWECRYGGGETINDQIMQCNFWINHKIGIQIAHNHLYIIDIRYTGRSDFWEYSDDKAMKMPGPPCFSEIRVRHQLEPEKIEGILNTKIKNCKFWELVQARAKELYNAGVGA